MHIGHLRTTVIGDALVRMLDCLGHHVVRENHIGDWGRPFGMLIEHLVDIGAERADTLGARRPRRVLQGGQRASSTRDADFQERARRRVVLLQRRRPRDDRACGEMLVDQSAGHWNDVYGKLGVLLTDDDLAGESRYEALMPEVIERLGAAGLLQESDGAEVVFPPGFTNRDGEPLPLIVRSRAGAFTYATSDLACVDRPGRAGRRRLAAVRRRRRAGPAPRDGVRGVPRWRGGWCRRRGPSTSRSASCSATDRKRLQEPQRRAGEVRRRHRRGDRAGPAPRSPRRTPSCRRSSAPQSATRSASAP